MCTSGFIAGKPIKLTVFYRNPIWCRVRCPLWGNLVPLGEELEICLKFETSLQFFPKIFIR